MINIAICDDEKIQVELLNTYVKSWARKNNIITNIEHFYSGESFEFTWSMDKKYHILLLDIEMSELNGVELAKKIRKEDELLNIIFITAIPAGQDLLIKANMATNEDRSGTQAITIVLIGLLSNLMGVILYGGIIFTLHPLFLGFIIISSLINYFLGNNANQFEYRNKDNMSPIQKKLRYIRTKAGDFKSAKDLRLYNMTSWFKDMYNVILRDRINLEKQNTYRKYLVNFVDGILAFLRDGIAYCQF